MRGGRGGGDRDERAKPLGYRGTFLVVISARDTNKGRVFHACIIEIPA